jgi:hypothetical protein
MKTFKRSLMGLGIVLLVAVSLQLFAPKAVHAIVSTLVTVANSSANPVPTLAVDNPAKTPFFASATCKNSAGGDQCSAQNFLAVPAGMTAVVQDVSGYCRVQSGQGALGIPIYTTIGSFNGGAVELSMGPQVPNGGSLLLYHFGRPVTFYVPSTAAAPDGLNFTAVTLYGVDCTVFVNGYYVVNGQ